MTLRGSVLCGMASWHKSVPIIRKNMGKDPTASSSRYVSSHPSGIQSSVHSTQKEEKNVSVFIWSKLCEIMGGLAMLIPKLQTDGCAHMKELTSKNFFVCQELPYGSQSCDWIANCVTVVLSVRICLHIYGGFCFQQI